MFSILLSISSQAQISKVEGTITDINTGSKISSASIQIVELSKTIAADIEGHFSINLDVSKSYSFRVSSVGYRTKLIDEIKPTANQILTVTNTGVPVWSTGLDGGTF